jgi:hypothetical protein
MGRVRLLKEKGLDAPSPGTQFDEAQEKRGRARGRDPFHETPAKAGAYRPRSEMNRFVKPQVPAVP